MNNLDSRYTPISMWGYFGYNILFGLPIIGFIILIVFALGHHNVNVKNYKNWAISSQDSNRGRFNDQS